MPSSGPSSTGLAPATPPSLGVVIVAWNVRALLLRCLATIRADAPGDTARVVVVDNASADDTVAAVREAFPDVAVIANTDNRGFTRANNQGLAALGVSDGTGGGSGDDPGGPPDAVLVLNPDTEVRPGALATLLDHLAAHPRCACVGPRLIYADGSIQSSRRRLPTLATGLFESTPVEWHRPGNRFARAYRMDDVPVDGPQRVDAVTGAAMLLRTAALRQVGGFDEGFFMYAEELDLCRRLGTAGWEVWFDPRAVVVHHEGKSSEQVAAARHAHFMRSRVRYFRKHHGRAAATVVRLGLVVGYAFELKLEAAKWLIGRRRGLRRARIAAYWRVLRALVAPDAPPER
jgi:N-acetylglucosaminyl-diphospho-decaprenol L-rhamnosyltransferase